MYIHTSSRLQPAMCSLKYVTETFVPHIKQSSFGVSHSTYKITVLILVNISIHTNISEKKIYIPFRLLALNKCHNEEGECISFITAFK